MRLTKHLRIALLIGLMATLGLGSGCGVYFNTFFNARKAFNSAEKTRRDSKTNRGGTNDYNTAITKCLKVVDNYPNSKYYDDALYMLGVSYFHTNQYGKAERRLRELLANYEDSKFARQANLYLAKSKLELGEVEEAMAVFQEIFAADYDRAFKGEAAMGLGQYHFDAGDYDLSRQYLLAVRDSLGTDLDKLKAQMLVADGYFERYKFADALGAYIQALGMNPDKDQRYHALLRAALSSYRTQRIDAGMAYLDELIEDELYFDSLGILKLTVGMGYEYDEDLELAEVTYLDVAEKSENRLWQADAYHRLGLMYQFTYDDLEQAKEYYDLAVAATRSSEAGRDALQRSSDIGKIETFAQKALDSTATQDVIDDAGYTQYLLSELYWFQLNKPDTAILEMQILIDSFPTAYDAPKAMIALSQMYREHYEDDKTADSILKAMLARYPGSDFTPEALDVLGLRGTAADTGYAGVYFHKAEDFLVDRKNPDSALYYYQYVADNYPDSKYFLQAKYNTIWVRENYRAPGDSSIIYAYQAFIDSFPSSELAREASRRAAPSRATFARVEEEPEERRESDELAVVSGRDDGPRGVSAPGSTTSGEVTGGAYGSADAREGLYYRRNPETGETDSLVSFKSNPVEVDEPFEFPEDAASINQYEWRLGFQILVDYSGRVQDYILVIGTDVPEIDARAKLAVGSMTFDPLTITNRVMQANLQEHEGGGYWFVYEFQVDKPEYLR
ncbi:MAG: tetratricopeptide repeat protein [candidate division Zixibacteria bacterium]|nr:tetratricopeptide repeat protein [candidate division Zixibacteria bacterium]